MPVAQALNQSNLGSTVTSRNISWQDLVIRAWGSEYFAPDKNIYQFSSGRNFDSTDQNNTGIYGGGATGP